MQCQSNELDYLPKSIDKMEKLEILKVMLSNCKFSAKLGKFFRFGHFLWNYYHFSTVLFLLKVGVKQEEKKPELKEIKLNGNDVYTCKYLRAMYFETPYVYTGVCTLMYFQQLT